MNNLIGYWGLFLSILFALYSQIIIKWQVNNAGNLPLDIFGKIQFLFTLLLNPWVMSAIIATFAAGVSWIIAMSKFELSYAYPFVSITYIFMMLAGIILFNETLTATKIIGTVLIMLGIIILFKN